MPEVSLGITRLHEIVGRDHGIEESYWGPSDTLSLSFFFFSCQNYLHRQTSFLVDVQRSVAESFQQLTLPQTNDKGSASRNLLGVLSNRYRTERTKTEYTIVDFYS